MAALQRGDGFAAVGFHVARYALGLFDEAVDDGRLETALRALGLWEWACRLPQGLDTPLGGGTDGIYLDFKPVLWRGAGWFDLDLRRELWRRLGDDLRLRDEQFDAMCEVVPFTDVQAQAQRVLDGTVRGRLVVDISR